MSGMSWIIYILVALILIIIIYRRDFEQAKRKTESLAAENGLQLVEFRSTLGAGRHIASFRFTVSDKQGKSKTGKIRFRTSLFGVSDPEVFWDDENTWSCLTIATDSPSELLCGYGNFAAIENKEQGQLAEKATNDEEKWIFGEQAGRIEQDVKPIRRRLTQIESTSIHAAAQRDKSESNLILTWPMLALGLCRWPKVFSQISWASFTAEALRPRRLRREE